MIVGHQKIRQILQNQVEFGRVFHAYLFWGPEGIGKRLVALEFARRLLGCQNGSEEPCECDSCRQMLNGGHPDFKYIEPLEVESENSIRVKEIGIPVAREILELSRFKPFRPEGRKVIVINDANYLTREAQDALLKTLEEAPGDTVFILIIENPTVLLETVRSRCQKVKFSALSFDDFQKVFSHRPTGAAGTASAVRELYSLSGGRPALALKFATPEGKERLDLARMEFLSIFQKELWQRYQISENLAKDEKKLQETINLWLGLARDLIMAQNDLSGLFINKSLEAAVVKEAQRNQPARLLKIFKMLSHLNRSLKTSNRNPRLALDLVMTEI